jgi:hypothetical protein
MISSEHRDRMHLMAHLSAKCNSLNYAISRLLVEGLPADAERIPVRESFLEQDVADVLSIFELLSEKGVILWPEKNIINESKGKVMSDLRISFKGDGKLKSNCLHKDSVDKAMLIA